MLADQQGIRRTISVSFGELPLLPFSSDRVVQPAQIDDRQERGVGGPNGGVIRPIGGVAWPNGRVAWPNGGVRPLVQEAADFAGLLSFTGGTKMWIA